MNKSDSIVKLSAALVKVQAELKSAQMDAVNPFLHNHYASLGSIIDASRPILAKNGLAVTQLSVGGPDASGGHVVGVQTVLVHESGEYLSELMTLPIGEEKGKSMAQVAGSIITYLRRYALASILGIYADEDTDGNAPAKQAVSANAETHKIPEKEYPMVKGVASKIDQSKLKQVMTIEDAVEIEASDGKLYSEMETAQLTAIFNAHTKKLKDETTPASDKPRIERDNRAIQMIIAEKNKNKEEK